MDLEAAYRIKSFEEIYEELQKKVFGKVITATDANSGSVLCTILEAVARVIAEAYLHCQIGYAKYLNELVEGAFGVKRKEGRKAKGFVIFACEQNKPAESDIYIAKGTEVAAGDMVYITMTGTMIEKGKEESKNVPCEAKEAGEKGNIPAGAINTILSGIHSKVKIVKNVRAFENGTSEESEVELRKRFIYYLRGLQRTNYYGVKEAALKAGAYHVNVVLCAPPKEIHTKQKDTTSPTGSVPLVEQNVNCAVYVCDKEGVCSADLLEDVRAMLKGKGSQANPGYTPAGVHIAVAPIRLDRRFQGTVNNLEVKVKSLMPDKQEAKDIIKTTIKNFFQKFEVGQSLILSDLIVAIRQHSFITDVIVVNPKPEQGSDNPAATEEDSLLVVREDEIKVEII
ncbi:baseplate J/gp47 family protein [Treponema putidum]|uniref:baseplate J/gp47 family protein n=1 Tax=Treponema putidum TaxID=221027 RepID=UPI003D8AB5FB